MILRSRLYDVALICLYVLGNGVRIAMADTPFDCRITLDNTKFDLTSLAGVHVVNNTRETTPTTMIDSLRFDLCAELPTLSDVPESDQCASGTRACLTKVNVKSGEPDRVISVIPIATTDKLSRNLSASFASKTLSLIFHGADYPTTNPRPQSLNLTLLCDPQETSQPKFVGYDGSRLDLEWSASAGCPSEEEDGGHKDEDNKDGGNKDGDNKDEESEKEKVGSGMGWFFLILFLSFAAYFGLGAYYNYSTYGARGYDLIPHRDFWKEVPYMLSDVVSHLCSNVRPRRASSRGGYVSV